MISRTSCLRAFFIPDNGYVLPRLLSSCFRLAVVCSLLFFAMGTNHAVAMVCRTVDGTLIPASKNIEQKFLLTLQGCHELNDAGENSAVTGEELITAHNGVITAQQLTLYTSSSQNQQKTVVHQSGQLTAAVVVPVTARQQEWTRAAGIMGSRALELAAEIHAVALEYNIDPLFLHAVAHVESRHDPDAISSAGARGVIQIMPATARRFGVIDPERELHDPLLNLRVGSAYLKLLQDLFGNNLPLVLAAYNAGEGAVIKYGRTVPPYRETQHYVRAVMDHYLKLKKL